MFIILSLMFLFLSATRFFTFRNVCLVSFNNRSVFRSSILFTLFKYSSTCDDKLFILFTDLSPARVLLTLSAILWYISNIDFSAFNFALIFFLLLIFVCESLFVFGISISVCRFSFVFCISIFLFHSCFCYWVFEISVFCILQINNLFFVQNSWLFIRKMYK